LQNNPTHWLLLLKVTLQLERIACAQVIHLSP